MLARRRIPADQGLGSQHGADVPGAVLLVGSLMLAVYAIVETSTYAWGSAHTLGFGALAVALLAGFVVRQATAANPLIPLRVFRSATVTGANLIQMLMVAGIFGMFFLGALYLQRVLRYDPIQVGLAFLPVALGIAAMSLGFSARLIERIGARLTLIPGLVLIGTGLLLFQRRLHACQLLGRPAAGDGAARDRRRAGVPVADDAGDVDGHPGGLGPGVRPGQHHPAGRRGARARGAGDARQLPHQRPARAGVTRSASALTGGYHLAFGVGAVLIVVGLVLAAVVLRESAAEVTEDEMQLALELDDEGSVALEPVR